MVPQSREKKNKGLSHMFSRTQIHTNQYKSMITNSIFISHKANLHFRFHESNRCIVTCTAIKSPNLYWVYIYKKLLKGLVILNNPTN